ncbi:MAG: hypothetical protein ACYDFS_08605 [Vulcanimicrobiaceae bacterium]
MLRRVLTWLGLGAPAAPAGLRPHRSLLLALPREAAYERARTGVEVVLGALVRSEDPGRGELEVAFGLVNSERLMVRCEALDQRRTRVDLEARFAATLTPPQRSLALEALAAYLAVDSCD